MQRSQRLSLPSRPEDGDFPAALGASTTVAPLAPWRARWIAWRNRLIASARFQAWAAAFPLTRPIARRRARALFDLGVGFVYTQVYTACVRLQLMERLHADGPQTVPALAAALSLPEGAAATLIEAAVALGLAQRVGDGRYALGSLGAAYLGNPEVRAIVLHHQALYADLADPVAMLRAPRGGGAMHAYWAYAGRDAPKGAAPEAVDGYSAFMAATQPMVAAQVLNAYPIARHKALLDIGGGEGAFLCAAAARAPRLSLMLFDLPAVAARARVRLAEAGLAGRTSVYGGSFFEDPLPAGADLCTIIRILHDHDDPEALTILCAARRALGLGGVLLVAEPMAQTQSAPGLGEAYFGFYLHAMGRGRPRTPKENMDLIRHAGFRAPRLAPTALPLAARLIVARV